MKHFTYIIYLLIFTFYLSINSQELLKGIEFYDSDGSGIVDKFIINIDTSVTYTEISNFYFCTPFYSKDSFVISGSDLEYNIINKNFLYYVMSPDIPSDITLITDFSQNYYQCKMYLLSNDSLVSENYVIDKVAPIIKSAFLFPSNSADTLIVEFSEPIKNILGSDFLIIYSGSSLFKPKLTSLDMVSENKVIFLFDSTYDISSEDSMNIDYFAGISDVYGNVQNNPNNRHVKINVADVSILKQKSNSIFKSKIKKNTTFYNLQGKKITDTIHKSTKVSNGLYLFKLKDIPQKLLKKN